MEHFKTRRKSERTAFTLTAKTVEEEITTCYDFERLQVLLTQLNDKFERLNITQNRILDQTKDSEYENEFNAAEGYRDSYLTLKVKLENKIEISRTQNFVQNNVSIPDTNGNKNRKFKLPKLELKKISRDAREYLGFWSQFSKIHMDPDIVPEDKFLYLVQCAIPGSKAAQLVNNFPPTASNYPKVIEQLKERFGRDDLLVQIYVRDLLGLVMKNAASSSSTLDLAGLCDSIESKLRALESLGRTKEKFADFLGPLVESCLPENILRAWERSRTAEEGQVKNSERTLESLMTFLRREVESEEMIKLARSGFYSTKKRVNKDSISGNADVETSAALVSTNETGKGKQDLSCIFCSKPHLSAKCYKAATMSLNDKKKIIQKKGACFSCLRIGHFKYMCKANVKCLICNSCDHLKLMCPQNVSTLKRNDPKENISLSNNSRSERVYLQVLCVVIKVKIRERKIRILLDSGSQRSYVGERLMRQMKANPIRQEKVIHGLFGGRETEPMTHSVFVVDISSLDNTFRCCFEAFSEKKICGFVPKIKDTQILEELKSRKIEISDSFCDESEIDLLIGADVIGKLLTNKFLELPSGLTAVKTKLGWTVMAKENETVVRDSALVSISLHVNNVSLKSLWELEALGITDPSDNIKKQNELADSEIDFQNKLSILDDGRYEVGLPWKCESTNLSDNKSIALALHQKMIKRAKENNFLKEYQEVFREWEILKIIERVPEVELNNKCHLLPHRPVIKLNSESTKIRPVFDASSCEKGKPSLNQGLMKGPNLIDLIPDTLDRMRFFPIGLSSDIEKAFLQIGTSAKDRDYLRFYYPSDEGEIEYRHCRVVFGVSCCPYLLGASIKHLLDNCPPDFIDVADKLRHSFYVDNCVTGVFNVKEQESFISRAENLMSNSSFNLRRWESNVACTYTTKHSGDTLLLGMLWNLDNDTLRCNIDVNMLTCDTKVTKRLILSVVQSIFDPIGILAPMTLLPKVLLQETWKQKFSWDEVLPDYIVNSFCVWLSDVILLKNVAIPRYVGAYATVELHVFVDASKSAYAACVFARSVDLCGVKISLLRAKSRVAPLKNLTIPRLELMACCIGSRLVPSICKALDVLDIKVTLWCDSTVALWWIRSHGHWSSFVTNRVNEITRLTEKDSWRHVPGSMNPADVLSKGCSPKQVLSAEWYKGPLWLKQSPESWPVNIVCQPNEADLEKRKVKLSNVNVSNDSTPWYAERTSNYEKMIRIIGWVLRFISNCRKDSNSCKESKLTVTEIINSEKVLIRVVQSSSFPDIKTLKPLDVFIDDDNVVRVKTKILERKDNPAFLSPVLLPSNCIFTRLLIESIHKKHCHAGIQMLQSILRERFWILKQRKTIRNVLKGCIICQRYKVKPMSCEEAPLPEDWVGDYKAFEIVGIDLAGPLFLKNGGKAWIALFTCAVYRAIHLELVTSISTESFLLALRRFIARRGRPRTIYSDNRTNFRGAYNELSKLNWDVVMEEAKVQRIIWKFNPPTASWWGGWWERLVRVIKELLRRCLGKAILSYEELETLICDCESVINSRPLTYVSESSQDLIPLTPSMFLMENHTSEVTDLDKIDSQHYQKRIRYRTKLFNDLRSRFRKEYLGQLIMKHTQNNMTREPKIGEIVLIGDDFKKRLHWPLAKVIEKIPGRDGKVRTVKLKTTSGYFIRPIQRIYPLEIQVDKDSLLSLPEVVDGKNEDSQKNDQTDSELIKRKFTSSGRLIKTPEKLDLFNRMTYVFDSFATDSKRGEDVTSVS